MLCLWLMLIADHLAQKNVIWPQEQMPPELIKKILIKKIEDKVKVIADQNQGLFQKITEKKSYIDSIKFKLLQKFNEFQEIKKQQDSLEALNSEKGDLESRVVSSEEGLGEARKRLESSKNLHKDQVELDSATKESIEEIDLIKKKMKRLFVFQLVELKKYNQTLIAKFLGMKKDRDGEMKELNSGLEYLKKKVLKLKRGIQPNRFD